MVRVKEGTKV